MSKVYLKFNKYALCISNSLRGCFAVSPKWNTTIVMESVLKKVKLILHKNIGVRVV